MAGVNVAPAFSPTYAEDTDSTVRLAALKRGYCAIHNDVKIVFKKSLLAKSEFVECARCSQEYNIKCAQLRSQLNASESDKSKELEAALLELNNLKAVREKELVDYATLLNELEDERIKREGLEYELKIAHNTVSVVKENERLTQSNKKDAHFGSPIEAKVCIIGDGNVGKTSLSTRYCHGEFLFTSTPTVGASFLQRRVTTENGKEVSLQIWDTAGQERFRSMAPMYYRGCKAAVCVFDVTCEESWSRVLVWLRDLKAHADEKCLVVFAANKSDKTPSFDLDVCTSLTDSLGVRLFRTSALTGEGVSEVFTALAEGISVIDFDIVKGEMVNLKEKKGWKSCC